MTPRFGFVALLVAVTACGGKILEEDQLSVDSSTVTPVANVLANPFLDGDDWQGTYTCEQGLTQLDLRIVSAHDDVIDDAQFDFDWTTGGASGSFHMRGTFDPQSGAAVFTQTSWIVDPGPTWEMVGMKGNATSDTFAGSIAGPGCTSFWLTKP